MADLNEAATATAKVKTTMFSDAKTLLMLSSLIEHGYDYHQRSVTGAVLCCAVLSKRTLSFFF